MKDITLVIVDNSNHDLAKFSIDKTLEVMDCKEVITFSDRPIIEGAKFIPIVKNINLYDYSTIMVKHLWPHVETDHVLTIQWDGMAINKDLWNNSFLDYDYIGAIWPWPIQGINMGNGGFSLRSRKLIDALRDTDIKLGTKLSGQNEDIAIAVEYRKLLMERHNINFAPQEVARQFSTENEWLGSTFGFHGLWNIPRFLNKTEVEKIIYNVSNKYWADTSKSNQMIKTLLEKGYTDLANYCYKRAIEQQ
jgi:hypothetical protein